MDQCCCNNKQKFREEEEKKKLVNRLNRIAGQINGIAKMIEEDRYCMDVLIQVSAVKSALTSFGDRILEEHLNTCVMEQAQLGNREVMAELMELIGKVH